MKVILMLAHYSHQNEMIASMTIGDILEYLSGSLTSMLALTKNTYTLSVLETLFRLELQVKHFFFSFHSVLGESLEILPKKEQELIYKFCEIIHEFLQITQSGFANGQELIIQTKEFIEDILSQNPAFIDIRPAMLVEGENQAILEIQGANITQNAIKSVYFDEEQHSPQILRYENNLLQFALPLNSEGITEQFQNSSNNYLTMPVFIALNSQHYSGLSSAKNDGVYESQVIIFRDFIGTVRAVFIKTDPHAEPSQFMNSKTDQPFSTNALSRQKISNFQQVINAPRDWQFLFHQARFSINSSSSETDSHHSARFEKLTKSKIALSIQGVCENGGNKNLSFDCEISVPMQKKSDNFEIFFSQSKRLTLGETVILPCPNDFQGKENIEFSHIEIEKFDAREPRLLLTIFDQDNLHTDFHKWGGLILKYDQKSQTAFVYSTGFT